MTREEFTARTKLFAVRVFYLVREFPVCKASDVVAYQLLKSSSSVAANHRATYRAKSKADFSNKLKIVLEEADESHFWLEFLADIELLEKKDHQTLAELTKEADELTRIFKASLNNS
jgi:four helix bundle protein